MRLFRHAALLGFVLLATPALAEDGFPTAMANAWAHCRDAIYQSAPQQADVKQTIAALNAFLDAWDTLIEDWGTHPPPPYDKDPDFHRMLAEVGDIAEKARHQAKAGKVAQAHVTLAQIRALLADARRREGLCAYADQLDEFDEALAEVSAYPLTGQAIDPDQFVDLLEGVGVLKHLAERMEKRAPARMTDDPTFLAQVEDIAHQVRGLEAAVLSGQAAAVTAALTDLRRGFDHFYLVYG